MSNQEYTPSPSDVIPFCVGIPPASNPPAIAPTILGANGNPIQSTAEAAAILDIRGESLTSLTWVKYCEWRRTKCKPRNLSRVFLPDPATESIAYREEWPQQEYIEELDQATLEFIGEVAELAELVVKCGPGVFYGTNRDKLIDECGDIFFCGVWVLDAWQKNPLLDPENQDDLEILRVTDEDPIAQFAKVIGTIPPAKALCDRQFVFMLLQQVSSFVGPALTSSGLLANSFKKLKFQRRQQDVDQQCGRVATVFFHVNQLLIMVNSSVEEALKANMKKLDARFPGGYKPGQGGGIRTGEGAGV